MIRPAVSGFILDEYVQLLGLVAANDVVSYFAHLKSPQLYTTESIVSGADPI
jgi:hypothetical protein